MLNIWFPLDIFRYPKKAISNNINGKRTNIHETVLYPFLHNQFNTNVQINANISLIIIAKTFILLNNPTTIKNRTITKGLRGYINQGTSIKRRRHSKQN